MEKNKIFKKIRRTQWFQNLKKKLEYQLRGLKFNYRNPSLKKEKRPIYIFNHIPKCGGTSLNRVFSKCFFLVKDYPPHDLMFSTLEEQEKALQKFILNKPNYLLLKPWQIISGHYHIKELEISKRFPGVFQYENTRVISFIRDPLEHRLSHYYYGIRKGHAYMKGVGLEDFLLNSAQNFIAQSLGCSEKNYKERIDQYFFIGNMDKFNDSIFALGKLLNFKIPKTIPHTNQTIRKKEVSHLDPELINKFKEYNQLEYKVYAYAKEKSEKFISESQKL